MKSYQQWICCVLCLLWTCCSGLTFGRNLKSHHYHGVAVGSRRTPPLQVRALCSKDQYTAEKALVFRLRGGALDSISQCKSMQQLARSTVTSLTCTPSRLFNALLGTLLGSTLVWKLYDTNRVTTKNQGIENSTEKSKEVISLQQRFLAVFWLLRMADWLQGPYFYEVYSSKILHGKPVSLDLVSKLFLVGFASTGVFGPWIGRLVDTVGRKAGTVAFTALYSLGALSTRSSDLRILLLGRLAGGLGTSLLFSAPEAWLVGEHQRQKFDGKWLGQTFGWAYAGDSLVAIAAGQLASMTASKMGPSGPFTLSVLFLATAALLVNLKWSENYATRNDAVLGDTASKPSIVDALNIMTQDKKIMLLGAVQALFEGAMYIFVLQWPPAIKAALQKSSYGDSPVPFGTIFSCFMTSCLLGSTLFSSIQKSARKVSIEKSTAGMLAVATVAMAAATLSGSASLPLLIAAFFAFEMCVGMYFPSIGTLRSKYLPDSHRSVLMNIFGIPLNLIVVSVFLSIKSLGVQGALTCATAALVVATACMAWLLHRIDVPTNTATQSD